MTKRRRIRKRHWCKCRLGICHPHRASGRAEVCVECQAGYHAKNENGERYQTLVSTMEVLKRERHG